MNSLKHGLTAETLVVDGENPDELPGFIAMTVDYFQPQNDFETELVLDLAAIRWRLRRVPKIETGLFEDRQKFCESISSDDYSELSDQHRLAEQYFGVEKSLDLLTRYETRLQRRYNQSLANLLKLRAAKPVEKNALNEPNPTIEHHVYAKPIMDHAHVDAAPAAPRAVPSAIHVPASAPAGKAAAGSPVPVAPRHSRF
ncbi:MAG: hypothetical protein ACRD8O_08490 [Bryobacteraceae bacterium]